MDESDNFGQVPAVLVSDEDQVRDPSESEDAELSRATYKITSYGVDYAVDGLVYRLRNGDIVIPSFQRNFIWSQSQSSRFIESLLLGLPVPGIFLSKDDDRRLIVIDGQQRLRSLQFFFDGKFQGKEFRLNSVVARLNGRTYSSLEDPDRRELDNAVIHATIVEQIEPDDDSSIYHIFERLNTGGTSLNPQEIRASIYSGPFNELLEELNENANWRTIFGPHNKRGKDIELILRFFALYYELDRYERPLNEFLNSFMRKHRRDEPRQLGEFRELFISTINLAFGGIRPRAFRPEKSLNAAVFDSVMVGLARNAQQLAENPSSIQESYEQLLKNPDYVKTYTSATTDNEALRKRISLAIDAFSRS